MQQNDKLVGLVYPDFDEAFAHGLKNEDMERVMEENRGGAERDAAGLQSDFKNENISGRVRKNSEEIDQEIPVPRG